MAEILEEIQRTKILQEQIITLNSTIDKLKSRMEELIKEISNRTPSLEVAIAIE